MGRSGAARYPPLSRYFDRGMEQRRLDGLMCRKSPGSTPGPAIVSPFCVPFEAGGVPGFVLVV